MARSTLPNPDPTAPATLGDSAKVMAWGLVFWAAVQLVEATFALNALAAGTAQAVLAEWGASRMTIAWSDPLAPPPTRRALAQRFAFGAALGLGVAVGGVAVALAAHTATWVAPPMPSPVGLGLGLVVATLAAVCDELLLRGVVVRATRGMLPGWGVVLACGGAAAAARLGVDGAVSWGMTTDGLRGVALGALWTRDRGAFMPLGANIAWAWTTGAVIRGDLLDIRFATDSGGNATRVSVLAAAAVAALAWAARPWGSANSTASGAESG